MVNHESPLLDIAKKVARARARGECVDEARLKNKLRAQGYRMRTREWLAFQETINILQKLHAIIPK